MRYKYLLVLIGIGLSLLIPACQDSCTVISENTIGWDGFRVSYEDIRYDIEKGILFWPNMTIETDSGETLVEWYWCIWKDENSDTVINDEEYILERPQKEELSRNRFDAVEQTIPNGIDLRTEGWRCALYFMTNMERSADLKYGLHVK